MKSIPAHLFLFSAFSLWAQNPPEAVSVAPGSGSGSPQSFVFTFSETQSLPIDNALMLISSSLNGAGACFIQYLRGGNFARLANDAANNWQPGILTPGGGGSLQNSQCTISNLFTSTTTNQLTVTIEIAFAQTFAGPKFVYGYAAASGGASAGWRQLGTWTVPGSTFAPQAVSVRPESGTGLSQTFEFLFRDSNGFQDLSLMYMIINHGLTAPNGCFVEYNRVANTLRLANDAANAWLGTVLTPGGAGSVQNSQCAIDAAASTPPAGSGNDLQVRVAITFSIAFAGLKQVHAFASDSAALHSGWQQLGAWNVPASNGPPQVVSVSPNAGSGPSTGFTFQVSDPSGFADITTLLVLINSSLNPANACFFEYNRTANTLRLANDAGNNWQPTVLSPGGVGTVQNAQCVLSAAGSAVVGSGTSLFLTVPVAFMAGFAGAKNMYVFAADTVGGNSGWQQPGAWTAGGAQTAPGVLASQPSSGSGVTQTFAFRFSDNNGFADVVLAQILINSAFSPVRACYMEYIRGANQLRLVDDSGAALLPGSITLGQTGTLQNSQCAISAALSSFQGTGNTLTVNLAITFSGTFGGAKTLFGIARDAGNLSSSWQTAGTWTVPGESAPQVVSVQPSSGSGSTQTFTVTFSDGNGFQDLSLTYLLVNAPLNAAGACFVEYNRAANTLRLANDAGNNWLPGVLTPGSAGTLANSQCAVLGASSGVSSAGNNLSPTISLTFAPGFAGAKGTFGFALDNGGLNSGWVQVGTWTVP